MFEKFWEWYERTYALNVSAAFGLFVLQVIHLVWLTGEVVWTHLFGAPLFVIGGWHETLIVLVDYAEIPAILSVSVVYLNELRKGFSWLDILFLLLLNSQWLHIFWITDEFVVTAFNEAGSVLPLSLAYLAIAVDYFEVPVMVDTGKKFFRALWGGTMKR